LSLINANLNINDAELIQFYVEEIMTLLIEDLLVHVYIAYRLFVAQIPLVIRPGD